MGPVEALWRHSAAVYAAWLASTEWMASAAAVTASVRQVRTGAGVGGGADRLDAGCGADERLLVLEQAATASMLSVGALTAALPRTFLSALTCSASCSARIFAARLRSDRGSWLDGGGVERCLEVLERQRVVRDDDVVGGRGLRGALDGAELRRVRALLLGRWRRRRPRSVESRPSKAEPAANRPARADRAVAHEVATGVPVGSSAPASCGDGADVA